MIFNLFLEIPSQKKISVALVLLLAACNSALAVRATGLPTQQEMGRVSGQVVDNQGSVLAGVELTVRCKCDKCADPVKCDCCPPQYTTTDDQGNFEFTLPVGIYVITARLPGFTSVEREIQLGFGQTVRVDIVLSTSITKSEN